MDTDRANRWLTLIANFGILLGLALVIFEIRQNSELLRLQFINDDLLATGESETPIMGDEPAEIMMKQMYAPEEMTYADYRVVDAYLTRKMDLLVRRYRLGQEGILDDSAWKTVGFAYRWHFGNEFARLWWKYDGREAYSHIPELVEHVDQEIDKLNADYSTASWSKIQSELNSQPVE